jgi:hypothetical protein
MTSEQRHIPTIKVPRKSLLAPTVLIMAYAILGLVDTNSLPAPQLVLATLAYLSVIWWRNISAIGRNVYDQRCNDRLLVGIGIALFALGWISLHFFYQNQMFMQRLFTAGPIVLGLAWLAFRNTKEVVGAKALWSWWRLQSPRMSAFAATVHGTTLLIRGGINELVIALEVDLLWILSCAALPIASKWFCDTAIIRGLVKRGAIYRNSASY